MGPQGPGKPDVGYTAEALGTRTLSSWEVGVALAGGESPV